MQDLLHFVQAFISYFIFVLLMQVLRLKALWLKAIILFFSRISTTAFGYTHECVLCKRLQCTVRQGSPKTYICTLFNPTWTGEGGISHLLYSVGCTYEIKTSLVVHLSSQLAPEYIYFWKKTSNIISKLNDELSEDCFEVCNTYFCR